MSRPAEFGHNAKERMPLHPDLVEDLDRLRAERPGTTQVQFYIAARRARLAVSKKDVAEYFRDYMSERGREVTHQEMPYNGKTYSEGPDQRWQADLAIYKFRREGFIGFLLVMDVFSRNVWAEPIRDKTAAVVLKAFKDIMYKASVSDASARETLRNLILTTDNGNEFRGAFRTWIVQQGVMWRTRSAGAKHDIAALDQAMGQLKLIMKQARIDARRPGLWSPAGLEKAVDTWNSNYQSAAHGSPDEVLKPPQ